MPDLSALTRALCRCLLYKMVPKNQIVEEVLV